MPPNKLKGITVEVIDVDPVLAELWLDEHNRHNRKWRPRKLDAYARDMAAGRWEFNGDPLRFDIAETLLDGQHRLAAIRDSKTTQPFVVVKGLRPQAQETVDIGATRTMGDTLTLRGESNASILAAIARRVLLFDQGIATNGGRVIVTHPEMSAYIDSTPAIYRAVEVANAAKQSGLQAAPSVVGAAYHLCARLDEVDAGHFFLRQLIDNVGLEVGDPARALLRRIQEEARTGRPMHPDDVLRYAIVAWNHFRNERQITKLQAPKGGWTAKNTPMPK